MLKVHTDKKEMSYIENINTILKPKEDNTLHKPVIDLFAGCGGLSLGFEAQGFKTIGYEKVKHACDTYTFNLHRECYHQELTIDTNYQKADIVIGGPPCQPFSAFGRKLGLKDSRDGFPIFVSAIKKIEPQIFVFENVRGLLFQRNKLYFEHIIERLENLDYSVDYQVLNAKYYDVPQNRERLFVVGYKKGAFDFPDKRNTRFTAGEALGELVHHIPNDAKFLTPSMDEYIAKYERASDCINPRDLYLNKPARTLTCRNIAAATSDMHRIKLPDGRRRRLFPRETARLQSFPDWFQFQGDEQSVFYQIGNAVPPMLAYYLAGSVKQYLLNDSHQRVEKKGGDRRKQTKQFELFHTTCSSECTI